MPELVWPYCKTIQTTSLIAYIPMMLLLVFFHHCLTNPCCSYSPQAAELWTPALVPRRHEAWASKCWSSDPWRREVMAPLRLITLQLKSELRTPVDICWTDEQVICWVHSFKIHLALSKLPASKLCRSPPLQWWGEQCNDLGPSQNQCKPHTCQAGLEQKWMQHLWLQI